MIFVDELCINGCICVQFGCFFFTNLQEEADIHIRDDTVHSSSDSENIEYIILDTVLPSIKSDQKFSDPCQHKIKTTLFHDYML